MSKETSLSVSSLFDCPSCHYDVLEEVQDDIVLASEITDIFVSEEWTEASYGVVDSYGGLVNRYQCKNCGYTIKNEHGTVIENLDDLVEWLINNKKKEE